MSRRNGYYPQMPMSTGAAVAGGVAQGVQQAMKNYMMMRQQQQRAQYQQQMIQSTMAQREGMLEQKRQHDQLWAKIAGDKIDQSDTNNRRTTEQSGKNAETYGRTRLGVAVIDQSNKLTPLQQLQKMEYDNNQKLIGEHINAMKPGPLGPQDPTVLAAHQAEINRLMQTQSGIMQSAPVSGAQTKPQGQPNPTQTTPPQSSSRVWSVPEFQTMIQKKDFSSIKPGDAIASPDGGHHVIDSVDPMKGPIERKAPAPVIAPVAPAPAVSPVAPPQAAVSPGLPAFSPGASEGVTAMLPRIFPGMAPASADPYGSSNL